MKSIIRTIDGNEAAAHVAYAFTEFAAIYPITPSSPIAENIDAWAANGRKNIFGKPVRIIEMQSEAGAAAAVHGAMEAGILTSTYTSSQGLLLMIPVMYRMAGQLKSGVIHVASRSVAPHAYSISAEHSDVMACRATGFAMLASSDVQEVMDLGAVAHLASIKGHVPFMHFFDGFRTSHEIQKIECLDNETLYDLVDQDALAEFRKSALNPEYPVLRTSGQSTDTYFQSREACTPYFTALPDIVEESMRKINKVTRRNYHLFNYYGAPDAEHVIVAMCSVSGTIRETVDYLNARGEKVGFLQVHLYRPFSQTHFLNALPKTVKRITVLDRTKEPGAVGDPLYEDVCATLYESELRPLVTSGRFGIGGKDTPPAQIIAVYENSKQAQPKNHFTVGICDDVSHTSLQVGDCVNVLFDDTVKCKFWGMASDGTVGANKNAIKIIGENTDMFVQAYFEYDGRKSGSITKSHLRFGHKPILSSYIIEKADIVACHNQQYVFKYNIISDVAPGGSFLLNCSWTPEELDAHLPSAYKKYIAENNVSLYTIDSTGIAAKLGMGQRVNTILQAAFFKILDIIPIDRAVGHMKSQIKKTYGMKGDNVLRMNYEAVDQGIENLVKIEVPKAWANCVCEPERKEDKDLPEFVRTQMNLANAQKGNSIPVSAFADAADGTMPVGTSKYERRGIAFAVPVWDKDACIQCNRCAYVCPHATIRPFLLNEKEVANAPKGIKYAPANEKVLKNYRFSIQINPLDCAGCASCVNVCPSKQKALTMEPLARHEDEMVYWDYVTALPFKKNPLGCKTVKGSQFELPLLEYPGACPGCGETPYAKLITQLFGDRMCIAAATGCAQVWSTNYPAFPYTTNQKGFGPAHSNSLFEDNAEFGMGICLGIEEQRRSLKEKALRLTGITSDNKLKNCIGEWVEAFADGERSKKTGEKLREYVLSAHAKGEEGKLITYLKDNQEYLIKKSVWMFGGDGWAYDIGYGGLDHVLASGVDVNMLVLDTEVYSNTGGQASKATQKGAVARFAASGKTSQKKDLGMMAMNYHNVYVAQVSMGADYAQLLKAVLEAEAYPGPSLIIAYAPCISHGLKAGMNTVQTEMKRAVEAGYWLLYRYNPQLAAQGKNPFIFDSKEPVLDYIEFLRGENRFTVLEKTFADRAEVLFEEARVEAKLKYEQYRKMAE
ncbi:MAG: pyruvate:ferredoxin (flavodoxin) oxidoreductase [Eubacteriales bacterium]|nr:pyruvate:ferredoxin (flavodoxin) oxidoreductase [Eubacteriales bacterium]